LSNELKFEDLQKKLKKVLNTDRFRFIFIFYPHINLREDVKNYICENFTSSNQITLNLKDNTYQNIAPILYENDKSFIFIDNFFDVLDNADLYNGFNQRRDKIASKNINLICFVNSNFKEKFFQTSIEYIPDLFEFKNAIFEIETPNNDENKLVLKEVSSSSYSSLGGLTVQSKKEELKRLLVKLENIKIDEQKLNLLFQIAIIYRDMGELKNALEYQGKSLKLTEEILGEKHPDLGLNYNNISTIYQSMGDLENALKYQEKALTLAEEILGEKYPNLASSYNNIAVIYRDMGELKKALEYQEKALKLREDILGQNHPDLASSYNNLSTIYRDMGELKKALEYQEKDLKLTEEILGNKHPDLATGYNNISTIYRDMGELKKALDYQEKALKLTEEILGEKHPNLAINYNNISTIYKDLKECLKAKEYMQKAIDIWKDDEYHKKELFDARIYIKNIDYNIKKNKKGRFCKDI
jgi:tetratricopeptide (TPR) repeat protein